MVHSVLPAPENYKLHSKQQSKEELRDLAWEQMASIMDRTQRGGENGHWRLIDVMYNLVVTVFITGPLCMQMYDYTPYSTLCSHSPLLRQFDTPA